MITEDDLRALLAEAAESAPPPGPAPEELVAGLDDGVARPRRVVRPNGRRLLAMAAVILLAVVAIAAIGEDDEPGRIASDTGRSEEPQGDADDALEVAALPAEPDLATEPGSAGTTGGGGAGSSSAEVVQGTAASAPSSGVPSAPAPSSVASDTAAAPPAVGGDAAAGQSAMTDSAKVVKTGSIDLEVREGAFTRALETLTSRVIGFGGYVAESTTSQSDDVPSGSIVVRVPEASFEALLTELRKLGDVQSVTSKGTDVSAQFIDLIARLASLTATRDRLGTVLREANNVIDILMVQDRMTAVQTEIELHQGQLRLLEDQTSMATLSVVLREPGADPAELRSEGRERDLGSAWDDARARFGDGIEAIVAGSGTAAVLFLAGAVLLLVARLAWPRLRRLLI